jgi:putative flippase GtrA
LLAVNVVLLEALTSVTESVLAAKVLAEVTLFAASYLAQRIIIFSGSDPGDDIPTAAPIVTASPEPR